MCYPSPMTVSCQSQNFTAVPAGIPYHSQRVFLQNNRITEVRAESFGFGTQSVSHRGDTLYLQDILLQHIQVSHRGDTLYLQDILLQHIQVSHRGDTLYLQDILLQHIQLLCAEPQERKGLDLRFLREIDFARCPLQDTPGRTSTFSTKWWFPKSGKSGHAEKSKGLYGRKGQQTSSLDNPQDDLFADLVNLTHLFLHGNLIRVLSENVFRGLVNLDRLLLHQNRIRQVHRRAFRDLGRLTILFLFNNSLSELPGPSLSGLRSLEFLRLNGNPWSCSCQARPLWEWFRRVRVSSSELLCAEPQERKGLDLRFLREIDFARCPLQDTPGRTSTFNTKWWFPKSGKSGHAEKSKGLYGRKSQQTSSLDNPQVWGRAKSFEPEPESALPKPGPQDYWENYENEDPSLRCSDADCLSEEERSRGERSRVHFHVFLLKCVSFSF
ncbi:UNVERIFIED_CONTAM: hypothetical protein FKN15_017575 [Acipenser sinensis]